MFALGGSERYRAAIKSQPIVSLTNKMLPGRLNDRAAWIAHHHGRKSEFAMRCSLSWAYRLSRLALLVPFLLVACDRPNTVHSSDPVGLNEPVNSEAASSNSAEAEPNDWPGFRGARGDGIAATANLSANWDPADHLVWKTELPGAGASSPIVFGDHIYLTCYSGYLVPGEPAGELSNLKRHLMAFDRATGEELWNKEIPAKLPEEERIRDHGYAASTPLADADHVYVFFGKTGVFAFDHEGNQKWSADVGNKTNGWGSATSPLLFGELLIVNASVESETLVALDRMTGKEEWKVPGIRESWNTPTVIESSSGRQELIVAIQGQVQAYDPASGNQLWTCETDIGWYMVPSVVADQGIVYCLGGRSGTAGLAIRAGGSGDVTATHRLWTSNKGSNVTSPIVLGDHLYWMQDNQEIAYCANVSDGEVVYEKRIDRADQVYASPVLLGNHLVYLGRRGKLIVIEASPEFNQVGSFDLRDGGSFDASPAVSGDRLLIRSDRFLYCFDVQ
jgi:outer membrane protein assembly factor BamB